MKTLIATLILSLCSAAPASATNGGEEVAGTYVCGNFGNYNGKMSLSATVFETEDERMVLRVLSGTSPSIDYELQKNHKTPFFNVYYFKAGPYSVIYYKHEDQFLVRIEDFSAICHRDGAPH